MARGAGLQVGGPILRENEVGYIFATHPRPFDHITDSSENILSKIFLKMWISRVFRPILPYLRDWRGVIICADVQRKIHLRNTMYQLFRHHTIWRLHYAQNSPVEIILHVLYVLSDCIVGDFSRFSVFSTEFESFSISYFRLPDTQSH